MSFLGQALGAGAGTDYTASELNLQNPVSQQQADALAAQAQGTIDQQNAFTRSINAQAPEAIAQQNALSSQLAAQARGEGPNPAQAALNQNTAANVANQASLAAGQRGGSANVGLLARQAGQQGAAIQQNAVGQSATMQAQQQLAAQNQLQNLAANQINQAQGANVAQNQAVQSEQQNILNAMGQYNQAKAASYGAQTSAQSAADIQNSKAQQGIFGGLLGGAGSILNKGGIAGEPDSAPDQHDAPATVKHYATGGQVPTPTSMVGKFLYGSAPEQNMQGQPYKGGNINFGNETNPLQAGTQQISSKGFGALKNLINPPAAQGPAQPIQGSDPADYKGLSDLKGSNPGDYKNLPDSEAQVVSAGPTTEAANIEATEEAALAGGEEAAGAAADAAAAEEGASAVDAAIALVAKGGRVGESKKGKVDALVSPQEVIIPPSKVKAAANSSNPIAFGKQVPGKPKVKGDSLKNDTVPKKLAAGSVVLPNHVMQSEDPPSQAAAFVRAVLAKQGLKRAKR